MPWLRDKLDQLKQEIESRPDMPTPGEAAGLAGAYGTMFAAPTTAYGMGRLAWKYGKSPIPPNKLLKTLRDVMDAKDVKIEVRPKFWQLFENAMADPVARTVTSQKPLGVGILAHEFGHLTGGARKLFSVLRQFAPVTALGTALGAPAAGYALTRPGESTGWSAAKGGLAGGGIGLAGMAPIWLEEVRASLRALKGMSAAKVAPKVRSRALKGLVAALGTYTVPGLLAGAGAGILGSMLARRQARQRARYWEGRR